MALRLKHAWRKYLGLHGSLWVFEEPQKPKPPSVFNQPAAWSTIIAAISAVLTAIFAYNNFTLTKQTTVQNHPPKLVATEFGIQRVSDGWLFYVEGENEGESEAVNPHAQVECRGNGDDATYNSVHGKNISPGAAFEFFVEGIPDGPKDGSFINVVLYYDDALSRDDITFEKIRKTQFCGILSQGRTALSSCEQVWQDYQHRELDRNLRKH